MAAELGQDGGRAAHQAAATRAGQQLGERFQGVEIVWATQAASIRSGNRESS